MSLAGAQNIENSVVSEGLRLPALTVDKIVKLFSTRRGVLVLVVSVLLGIAFRPWLSELPHDWFKSESYVQHGVLVPFASLYIGWLAWVENRDRLALKSSYWPVILILPISMMNSLVMRSGFTTMSALLLIGCIACTIWSAMGGRWLFKMTPALFFLTMTFSWWGEYIDQMTLSAQTASSNLAFKALHLIGMQPKASADDPNLIYLPHFDMNVGAACSGLKLTLAVLTCALFIVIVGKLKWWGNLALLALVVPMALVFNSIRIVLIGVIGEYMGNQAGMWMHDYGSYGVLILAFFTLYKISVKLGWKI